MWKMPALASGSIQFIRAGSLRPKFYAGGVAEISQAVTPGFKALRTVSIPEGSQRCDPSGVTASFRLFSPGALRDPGLISMTPPGSGRLD
jgi:hypothetical protein